MSGGYFDYNQYKIEDIIEELKTIIKVNKIKDDDGHCYNFSKKTINEFEKALKVLQKATIYVQRIDWLVCSDDGEKTFHQRLKEELNNLK